MSEVEEIVEEPIVEEIVEEPKPEPTPEEIEYSKSVQKRIDKEVYKRREAERQAQATHAELAAIKLKLEEIDRRPVDSKADASGKPDPNKYASGIYDPQYMEDLTDYKVEMRTRQIIDEQQKSSTMSSQRQRIDALEADAVKAHPDYSDVIGELLDHPITAIKEFQGILADCDNPAELSYYLGKNPDELDKIAKMTTNQATRYLGKLEATLSTTPTVTKKSSDAPAPPTPIKGAQSSQVATKDPEKMTMAQYAAWRKSQQAK